MNELVLTRDLLFKAADIAPARELRRSHQVIRDAHTATRRDEEGDVEDHAIRLKAADLNLKLIGAYPEERAPSLSAHSMIVVWNTTAQEIPPPASRRTGRSSIASGGSNGSRASSAIAAGERRPSA